MTLTIWLSIHDFASKVLFIFRWPCSSTHWYCDWKRTKIMWFDFFKTYSKYIIKKNSKLWSFFKCFETRVLVPDFLDFSSFSKKANFDVMENNFLNDSLIWHYVPREMKVYTFGGNKYKSQTFIHKTIWFVQNSSKTWVFRKYFWNPGNPDICKYFGCQQIMH